MLELGFKTLVAYLLGLGDRQPAARAACAASTSATQGSGNAGGTNALRTQGWGFALGVIVIDVGKALLAVGWLPGLDLPGIGIDPAVDRDWLAVACAAAVVFGHVYPGLVRIPRRQGRGDADRRRGRAGAGRRCVPVLARVARDRDAHRLRRPRHDARHGHAAGVFRARRAAQRCRCVVFGLVDGGVHRLHAPLERRSACARATRTARAVSGCCGRDERAAPSAWSRLLADGALHSGERLAADLGVTRAAVWKLVAELRERGIAVESLERRGYQLPQPVELLDAAAHRGAAAAARLGRSAADSKCCSRLDSTNDYLHAAARRRPRRRASCSPNCSTAGRGRRGRAWLAPFGSGLTFSIGWTFAEMPAGPVGARPRAGRLRRARRCANSARRACS